MAKREIESELVDEQPPLDEGPPPVGERLRAAREAKGLSLEDVAAQTRIPQRHLASIETADWDSLPAATYTIGFAKNYASAVDLDRSEIGSQLREEMGGQRFASTSTDVFEPADPARTMPKSLVIGAILAVVLLVVLMSWLNRRSLDQPDQPVAATTNTPAPALPATVPPPSSTAAVAQGPVVLTASAPVWFQVSERGGASLFSGTLQPGQTYTVPATATAPVLKTGKPEALTVNVGTTTAPSVGPAATTVSNVSLLAADLLKPAAPAAAPASPPPARQTRTATSRRAPAAPPEPAPQPLEPGPTTNSGE